VRTLVGAAVAVLVALAAASGVAVAVSMASAPDKNVNFEQARTPDVWADTVDYGRR
jgi:hypothetical protein